MQTQIPAQAGATSGILSMLLGGQGTAGSALPAGLQGLFAALVAGGQEAAATDSDGLLASLLGTQGDTAEGVLAGLGDVASSLNDILTALQGVSFTEGSTTTVSVETLTVQLQQLVVTLEDAGVSPMVLGKPDELALALHQQGMSMEKALTEADRINEAMNFVRKKLGLSEISADDQSSLLAFMNTATSTTALTQVTVEATQVEVQVTSAAAQREQQVAMFAAQKEAAPVKDVAEKAMKDQPLVKQAAPQVAADAQVKAAETTPEGAEVAVDDVLTDEALLEADEGIHRAAEQHIAATGEELAEEAPIVTARQRVGDHTKMPVGEEKPVAKAIVETAAAASENEGMRVSSSRVTEAPEPIQGTTIYKWQSTKAGMDVVAQVQDPAALVDGVDVAMDAAGDTVEEAGAVDKGNASRTTSFSEKMAAFARAAHVGQQVAPAMKTLVEQGGGQVRVKLHPAELGEIDIDLKIKDGHVHGTIASQNPEVLEQMARELQQLKQGLTDAGFQLGEEGIAFMLQDQGQDGSGGQQREDNPQLAADDGDEMSTDTAPDVTAASRWVNPDQLLDVRV